MTDDKRSKVIIIGTGPAGYTAALYTARAELKPIVIDGTQPGGQLMTTTEVENFPGFPDGLQGPEMMALFRKQAERFGTRFVSGTVTSVDFTKRPFTLTVDEQHEYKADAVIVATGASARYLGLESELALIGYGVSACATCDGFFYRGKEVIVIGGGDSAMEEATFLTRFADKVTIVHRRGEFRASKIMQRRALDNPKIDVRWHSDVVEVVGTAQTGVTGVKIKNRESGEINELSCHGVFLAIGHKPNTDPFVGKLELLDNGYLKVEPGGTRTSVEGVFAAGDVADHHYRQAVTAAGTGCMAAIDAERWLAEHGG
ncbi:MAG: thioredoxin-disulfide reductase [Myxococcales bacterium]|nr:thioredoxin-disulfide reductase [Myxococcales bacterium]